MKKIRIIIADNYRLNRDSWAFILNSDSRFEVIAECADAAKTVELAMEKQPDIILMNIDMPLFAGMEATEKIRKKLPATHVIGISVSAQLSYAKKMIKMGAKGYITKNSSREELIHAILEVKNGNKYICEEIKNTLSVQMLYQENTEPDTNSISKRELEILNLVKEGLSSKQVADTLFISYRTVEVHRHNILKKLKLKNTASLVNYVNSSAMFI